MDDLLDKINEQYSEDLAKLFPLHRVLIAIVALPPFLDEVAASRPVGMFHSYALWSLEKLFGPESSAIPQHTAADLLLFLATLAATILGARLIQDLTAKFVFRHSAKAKYLRNIATEGAKLLALPEKARDETARALRGRYLALKKPVTAKARLSEVLYGYFLLSWIFFTTGTPPDIAAAALALALGILLQFESYRYYVSKVAPPYLLWAIVSGQLIELGDGVS